MKFDLNLRSQVRTQLRSLAGEMSTWQSQTHLVDADEVAQLRQAIGQFRHTSQRTSLTLAGVDGSGDFPSLSYADTFIYLSVAQGVVYAADRLTGLREVPPGLDPLIQFCWLPMNRPIAQEALDRTFTELAGMPMLEVMRQSDYRALKAQGGKAVSVAELHKQLIRPDASDTGNLAIQLRSTAEFGAALRLIQGESPLDYVLVDTTYSLPLLSNRTNSLFYEHLKRLCCVEARQRDIGFFALSKSHGLPAMEKLEALAAEVTGAATKTQVEHWYVKIPEAQDGWSLSITEGRRLPPVGAVTYLVKFHRTTPVLRLDVDRQYWQTRVLGETEAETRENEQKIFEDLDYACHDQRAYGYPYPIKAAHDRSSLTRVEREAFRKQIIAEAVQEGISPALFRDASKATGHS